MIGQPALADAGLAIQHQQTAAPLQGWAQPVSYLGHLRRAAHKDGARLFIQHRQQYLLG